MTLTNEQIEALGRRLEQDAERSSNSSLLLEAAAALRQLAEDNEALRHNVVKFCDDAKRLRGERDREDRLLRAGWIPLWHEIDGYCWKDDSGRTGWIWHPDRATAARLAEEKMNGSQG